MNLDWKRIPKVLHNITFEVSGDSNWNPYHIVITTAVEDAIAAASKVIHDKQGGDAAIQKLQQFAQQYPRFPMFKNHLFSHYFYIDEEAPRVLGEVSNTRSLVTPPYIRA